MKVVRTLAWVLLLAGLLVFSYFNWTEVEVQIWDSLIVETKVPALVIVSFLLGLLPMWMVHRGRKWQLGRRIKTLENAARANSVSQQQPPAAPAPQAAEPADSPLQPATPRQEGGPAL